MLDPRRDDDQPLPSLKLRRELSAAANRGPEVPEAIDHAVRGQIAARFVVAHRIVARRRAWLTVAAVAAMIVAAVGLPIWMQSNQSVPTKLGGSATLATALREVERLEANDIARPAAIADARVQAILMSVVAMPSVSSVSTPDGAGFAVFDLYVAPRQALAAWQCELVLPGRIVGIEGGDGAFTTPATYDRAALAGSRVVLASIGANAATSERIRVASVTVQLSGDESASTLNQHAWSSGGQAVAAEYQLLQRMK